MPAHINGSGERASERGAGDARWLSSLPGGMTTARECTSTVLGARGDGGVVLLALLVLSLCVGEHQLCLMMSASGEMSPLETKPPLTWWWFRSLLLHVNCIFFLLPLDVAPSIELSMRC